MKIRKRREPLDFGALAEGETSQFDELELLEVAPDFDLSPAEPPPEAQAVPVRPTEVPRFGRQPINESQAKAPVTAPAEASPQQPTAPNRVRVEMQRAPATPNLVKAPPAPLTLPATPPVAGVDADPDSLFRPLPTAATPAAPPAPTVAKSPPPPAAAAEPMATAPRPIPRAAPPAPKAAPTEAPKVSRSPPDPVRASAPQASPAAQIRPEQRRAPETKGPAAGTISKREAVGPSATPIYVGAALVSVLWACAPIAFALGYRREVTPFQYDPFALAVFALLAVGPAALIWIAAYLLRQGQLLALEARRAKTMADELVSPMLLAAGRAGDVAVAMREEIARASQTAKDARETLLSLKESLAGETERLAEATGISAKSALDLAASLGVERVEMAGLSKNLEAQAESIAEAIARQTQLVTDASDLAVTQLREAEALLAARSADLTAAAGIASDAARTAGEDLTRHIARLDTAGAGVAEQISAVEAGLADQRAALVAATHGLRADQEVFAAEAESQTAKLSEFIGHARNSALEMGDRAIKGADALQALIAEAADQFREFAAQAAIERDAFGASTQQSLAAVAAGAAEERAKLEAQTRASIEALSHAAEETRQAAQRHADAAREQVDQLAEAAFSAGQRANQVFEARLSEARDLIERSSQMVEQAGAATAKKLEEGADAARVTLQDLERMLGEIEQRALRLPGEARRQADEVRTAMTRGMDELMQQARRTAEETESIDQAFQDRVHRNYEMLSEAVRLMGAVAGGPSSAAPPAPKEPRPTTPRPAQAEATPVARRATAPSAPAKVVKEDPGLRPRLKLTPTATDEEFSSVFETAGGRTDDTGESGDGWTWKELLSSIDSGGGPDVSHARIEETLISEISAMGIDPAALLPRTRVEEIVDMVQGDDSDSRRILVRRLAPAATRRLARRLFTDAGLKQQVRKYVARYERLLEEAAKRDEDGLEVGGLLASDAGRAFLLLDAAAGDAD